MGVKVGIDLGTTYSAVARLDPVTGKPVIVPNSFGEAMTPSAVALEGDGSVLFGEEAKDEFASGSQSAAALYKRDMGNDSYQRTIGGRVYSATDLSAVFLRALVADAEEVMGERVDGAVITVPAYFAHAQVKATMEAARQAGLNLLSTIHEPTAAALAYGLDKADVERTVLFYDLGGGTFDVTIARVSHKGVTVLGSDGDHRLGGKDWDDAIARYVATMLSDDHGIDVSDDTGLYTAIQSKCEQAKRQLSARREVAVPVFASGQRLSIALTQDEFAQIAEPLCERTLDIVDRLFQDLMIGWRDIDAIILVGGSTRMPMVRAYLEGRTDTPIEAGVQVDQAVALGAAIKANASMEGSQAPGLQLGVIGGPAPQVDPSRGEPPQSSRLAIGFTVTEVVAHALGMIAVNSAGTAYTNSQIIRKNTPIPASSTLPHAFKASARNTEMEIYVLQGDSPRPLDNTVVNKYVATDIRPSGGKGERIEVTYSYDADGLIVVSASQDGRSLPVRIDKVPEDMSWADQPPRKPVTPTIVLSIDLSGSMSGSPLAEAKVAMSASFLDALSDTESKIGVLLFADHASWRTRPTTNHKSLRKAIAGITIGQGGVGYGNATDPFQAGEVLSDGDYLIVLTDGVWSNQPRAIERARELHRRGINVVALGFGSADIGFLKQIASAEDFAGLTDLSLLGDSFGRIAQVVQSGTGSISLR